MTRIRCFTRLFIPPSSQLTHSALAHTIMVLHTQSYLPPGLLLATANGLISETEESQVKFNFDYFLKEEKPS